LLAQPKSGLAAASAHAEDLSNAQSSTAGTTTALTWPKASSDIFTVYAFIPSRHHAVSATNKLA
jgi:hypothetical protein